MPITSSTRARLLTNAERCRYFGTFPFCPAPTPENPERIEFLDDWKRQNLVEIHLTGIEPAIGPDDAWVHKLMKPHFEMLLAAWNKAGLSPLVLTWNGAFAARFKRGRAPSSHSSEGAVNKRYWEFLTPAAQTELIGRLSAHSWGTAFDINARWNGLGKIPARANTKGSVLPLVPIAEELGWVWGGRWRTPDAMHFEWSGRFV